jgi:secreted trypsin-like serine protease
MGKIQGLLGLVLALGFAACTLQKSATVQSENLNPIIGGVALNNDSTLSQRVALLFNRKTNDVCTVSILNNQFALTAAHCVADADAANLYLVFDVVVRKNSPIRRVASTAVSKYFKSENTRPRDTGDIALVRFADGVPRGFKAARFLPDMQLLKTGVATTAVGYGATDEAKPQQAGSLHFANLKIANSAYSDTEMTLAQTNNVGVCVGDSGGPVYHLLNGEFYLWGVISRSTSANCSEAAIVTNALVYLNWIQETVISMGRENMELPDVSPTKSNETDFPVDFN